MDFLESLEITFLAAAFVVFLLHKMKVPSLVGFLVAGAIIGPLHHSVQQQRLFSAPLL